MDSEAEYGPQQVAPALAVIRAQGRINKGDWPLSAPNPQALGLVIQGEHITLPPSMTLHDADYLAHRLREQWGSQPAAPTLKVFDVVDSTNTQMAQLANTQSIAGHIYLAEFQSSGRGRRGRQWLGGYGRNIAMTVGWRCQQGLSELGGLSCVVGIALIQVLEQFGVNAHIKWPNDIWVEDRKLSGVLVELAQTSSGIMAMVGIGLNVSLTAEELDQVDQDITSLSALGIAASRDDLVLAITQALLNNFAVFEAEGFAVFVPAFNAVHRLHNQQATLHLGKTQRQGIVRGLDTHGALLFEEASGVSTIQGGEVSLRPTFQNKA